MSAPNARSGSRWRALVVQVRSRHEHCGICGQSINYTIEDPFDPEVFTVDHKQSWSRHPELRFDLANLQAAHRRCNLTKGSSEHWQTTGMQTEQW